MGCASLELDGTLNGSTECELGVSHQRHRHYHNPAVRLATGCYSTDRALGGNKE